MSGKYKTSFVLISNQVTIDFEMLSAFMENRIFSDVKDNLIITPKRDRRGGGNTKIKEKASTPLKLTNSSCQTAIFGLNGRTRKMNKKELKWNQRRLRNHHTQQTYDLLIFFFFFLMVLANGSALPNNVLWSS